MKSVIITLVLALVPQLASAENRLVHDPSGAPMCADADGVLAPLADCADLLPEAETYTVEADPSGAPMCFASNGELAPLAMCGKRASSPAVVRSFHISHDPSGAPMCFADSGKLAPLASCSSSPQLAQLTARSSNAAWR